MLSIREEKERIGVKSNRDATCVHLYFTSVHRNGEANNKEELTFKMLQGSPVYTRIVRVLNYTLFKCLSHL